MPLYMDVHRNLVGVTPDALAQAHLKDVEVQSDHGVCYHKYWFNQETNSVYCLVEGPNREACDEVHRKAHGLVADDLIEVQPALVEAFLGSDPANEVGAAIAPNGNIDAGCRVLVFTDIANLADAAHRLGDAVAMSVLREHDSIVRSALKTHGGREVQHTGTGIMSCFASASGALKFATEIQTYCSQSKLEGESCPQLRIGMAMGEPVENNDRLFGASVTAARRICEAAEPGQVVVSAAVHELAFGKGFSFGERESAQLKDIAEPVSLYRLQLSGLARKSSASRTRSFVGELRRRGVITTGIAYAGVLFVLLQVAQLTFEPLNLPDWSYTLLLVIGIFGFPLAIVLAWVFDLTASGLRRE